MNAIELAEIQTIVEAQWAIELDWDLARIVDLFDDLELDCARRAVGRAARRGDEFPPRPATLAAIAREIQSETLRHNRMTKALPPPEGDTGPDALRAFMATHDGLTPSQWARKLAGVDPGSPAVLEVLDDEGAIR